MWPTRECWPICCTGKKPGYGVIRLIADKLRLSRSARPGRRTTRTVATAIRTGLTKRSVRSKVEHVFQVMKLKFGFVKLRYRGLKKNAHQLFVICGLVNLFLSRQKLLTASA